MREFFRVTRFIKVSITLFVLVFAGAGPALSATISLSSDFAADSLTINDGDTLTTNGYNVDIGAGGITIAADGGSGGGHLDATTQGGRDSAITVEGDWSTGSGGTFTASTSSVIFDGTTSATLDPGGNTFNTIDINKTSGVDADDNLTVQTNDLTVNGTLSVSDGELIQQRSITAGAITLTDATSKWTNTTDNANVTLAGDVNNTGIITFDAPTGDLILIRSSAAGTQRNWQGTGTFSMTDVDAEDQSCTGGTPANISVASGTNSGNNINWIFGSSTIGGTVYNGYFGAAVAGITVTVAVYDTSAGTVNYYTDVTDGSGVYSITNGTIDTGDVIAAYLDDLADEGTGVTKANSNGSSIAGLDVHYDSVYIFDEGGGIANSDLANLDSNIDNDINYTISGGDLTLTSTFWLGIAPSASYTPGGNVTLPGGALGIFGGGTLTAGSNIFTLSVSWVNLGTFTANSSTVIINGATTVNNGGDSFFNVTIGDGVSGGSATISSATDINGILSFNNTGGAASLDLNGQTLNYAGGTLDLTNATLSVAGSTIVFDGAGTQNITSAGNTFNNLSVTNSADIVTFTDSFSAANFTAAVADIQLTFNAGSTYTVTGSLNLNGQATGTEVALRSSIPSVAWNLDITGGAQIVSYVDVQDSSALTNTVTANNSVNSGGNNANWIFSNVTRYWVAPASGNWDDNTNWATTSGGTGGADYPAAGDTAIFDSGSGNCVLAADVNIAVIDIQAGYSGRLDANGFDITTTSTVDISAGELELDAGSDLTVSGTLTVDGGLLDALNGSIDADGSVNISGGTMTAPSGNFNIAGNFQHTGGVFNNSNGSVILDGTNQSLTGSTTFYNLTKAVATADTLMFDNIAMQTVAGTLALNGASGQLLSLRSDIACTPGLNQWDIDPQGPRNVFYLDVECSNNVNATFIAASNSSSSGNNTGWYFSSLTMDVDNDGTLEEARDVDGNPANGYEVFFDPGGSVISTPEESIDGDGDTRIDHFIDIDGDSVADKYWDPEEAIFKDILLLDVNGDGTDDWVYDSDDNGSYDHAFNDATSVFIDPFGVVFDSSSNALIAGAVVTIYNNANGQPCVPDDGIPPAFPVTNECIANGDINPVITDSTGTYGFNALVGGSYYITVNADEYTYPFIPSTKIFSVDKNICVDNPPDYPSDNCWGIFGSRGEVFVQGAAVISMDHPMDPGAGLIILNKTANKKEVSIGEVVTYTISIGNRAATDIKDILITDRIPAGFKYISDRAILDGSKLGDPEGGRPITFNIGTVGADDTRTLKYQLVVGSGVSFGKYENSAWARYNDGKIISNVAREYVTVVPDPLFDLGTVIGKVFHDRNENGVQDGGDEPGLGDVQIVTEEGTVITTDKHGKYHLAGITPGRHILRIDERTLPDGMHLTTDKAVIIDITPGILQKVNFGVNTGQKTTGSSLSFSSESIDNGQLIIEKQNTAGDRKKNDFLFVVLADGKAGFNEVRGNIEPVGNDKRFQDGFWSEGRIAYYLKGKIKGKYLVTSSFDTDRENKELFRDLDPDKYYPVYGDGSTVNYEASDTQGMLYLAVEWDKSKVMWGNYNTGLTDTELASFNRTLYGAKLHIETVSTTPSGKPLTKIIVFQAQAKQKAAHNEFIGTGGSLYYLKHRPVIEGSEKVAIHVRDKNTGLVIAEVQQVEGEDYEIDYSNGRIMFFRPVSQIAAADSIISSSLVDGDPLYVVVDYEYEVNENEFSDWSYGGRVEQSITGLIDKLNGWILKDGAQSDRPPAVGINPQRRSDSGLQNIDNAHPAANTAPILSEYKYIKDIRLGGTFVKESKDTGNYELKGIDTALYLGEHTLLTGEYSESDSRGVTNFISSDGGLSFTTISNPDSAHGTAYSFKAVTKLFDRIDLDGHYKRIGSGFSDSSTVSQQGKKLAGANIGIDLSGSTRLNISHDMQKLLDNGNALTSTQVGAEQTDTTTVNITRKANRLKLTGEYRHIEVREKGDSSSETNIEGDTVAARADYDVKENISVFLEQQATLKGNANYRTAAGVSVEPYDWLKLTASGTVGTDGNAASAGTNIKVNEKTEIYNTFSRSDSNIDNKKTTIVAGSRSKVSDSMDFSSEIQQSKSDSETSSTNILGLSGKINERWGISGSFARGVVQDASGDISKRNAGSIGATYTIKDIIKASSKLEVRIDNGQENEWQYLSYNAARWQVNGDTTLFGKVNLSVSRNTTLNTTEADYKELILGSAYRPVNFDRLNLLAKYTYLEDDITPGQTDSADIEELRAHVLSGEAVYDLTGKWQIVEKLALRQAKEKVAGFEFTKTLTWLWINRINYNLYRNWQVGAEYRVLGQRQAEDIKQGALIEVARYISKNVQVGIGYNFTTFDDDLTYLDYTSHGPFIRLTVKLYD